MVEIFIKSIEFVVQKVSIKIMHKSCLCIEAIVKKGSLKFNILQ
jgi:hypothetical protein